MLQKNIFLLLNFKITILMFTTFSSIVFYLPKNFAKFGFNFSLQSR
jgi:hypothetical protein